MKSGGGYALEITKFGPQTRQAWVTAAKKYIDAAHAAGVKVLCSLGGDNAVGGSVFMEAGGSDGEAQKLAQAVVAALKEEMGFDGVDLDWEGATYDPAGAVRILKSLRQNWPDGIITTAVGPTYDNGASTLAGLETLAEAAGDIDAFMMMTYIPPDQTWTWWVVPVPVTPLHGTPTPWGGTQLYSIDHEIDAWGGAGVPASKLIMGVGGFGVAWADRNGDEIAPVAPYANFDALGDDPSAPADGGESAPYGCVDNYVTQIWVDEVVASANGALLQKEDTVGGVTYYGAPANDQLVAVSDPCGSGTIDVGLIFYETPTSMAAKTSYCGEKGKLGMGFWTLSQMVDARGRYPILETVKP